MRCLPVLGGLMPVPDLSAVRYLARLLEIFVIAVANILAEDGSECKLRILSPHVHEADSGARRGMKTYLCHL